MTIEKNRSPVVSAQIRGPEDQKIGARVLYHAIFCPFSRKIRWGLLEKGVVVHLKEEKLWRPSEDLYAMNPEGGLPVLKDGHFVIVKSYPLLEYLEENPSFPSLLGHSCEERAEVRRLVDWFDGKFYEEVTRNVFHEKIFKRHMGQGGPDSYLLKQGRTLIHDHLEYIGWLFDRRNWLGGNSFSWADITAASHLSCLDYLGDVPWEKHLLAKDWYMRVKSRPHFRPFLREHLLQVPPSPHYRLLDF